MKPTVSIRRQRKAIRDALRIRPGIGKTERVLLDMVNELVGGGISLQELRDGLEYCLSEKHVRSKYNNEAEEDEWFITQEGLAVDVT